MFASPHDGARTLLPRSQGASLGAAVRYGQVPRVHRASPVLASGARSGTYDTALLAHWDGAALPGCPPRAARRDLGGLGAPGRRGGGGGRDGCRCTGRHRPTLALDQWPSSVGLVEGPSLAGALPAVP